MNVFIWIVVIYLIGYILGYYISKFIILVVEKEEGWDWTDVRSNAKISIFSWILVLAGIIYAVCKTINNKIKIKFPTKPPFWL